MLICASCFNSRLSYAKKRPVVFCWCMLPSTKYWIKPPICQAYLLKYKYTKWANSDDCMWSVGNYKAYTKVYTDDLREQSHKQTLFLQFVPFSRTIVINASTPSVFSPRIKSIAANRFLQGLNGSGFVMLVDVLKEWRSGLSRKKILSFLLLWMSG